MKKIIYLILISILQINLFYSQSHEYFALRETGDTISDVKLIKFNDTQETLLHTFKNYGLLYKPQIIDGNNNDIYFLTDLSTKYLLKYNYNTQNTTLLKTFEVGYFITPIDVINNKYYIVISNVFGRYDLSEIDLNTGNENTVIDLTQFGDVDVAKLVNSYIYNGKIYLIFSKTNNYNNGAIYSYEISSNTLTLLYHFDNNSNGLEPKFTKLANGYIYGATSHGGTSNFGVLFRLNLSNGVYEKLYDLNQSHKYLLFDISDNKLYGDFTTNSHELKIFSYDIQSNNFSILHTTNNVNYWEDYAQIPVIRNNILFNTYLEAGFDAPYHFFSYNFQTNQYNEQTLRTNHQVSYLLHTHNDRIFLITDEIDTNYEGKIYEVINDQLVSQNNENVIYGTSGCNPSEIILSSYNGKIYGLTAGEGTLTYQNYGQRFFSYNPDTNEYNNIINFNNDTDNAGIPVNLMENPNNGKIYFFTTYKGWGNKTVRIYEYNPQTNSYQVLYETNNPDIIGGSSEVWGVIKDNIIYGYIHDGGTDVNHKAVLFKLNTITHDYTLLHRFQQYPQFVTSLMLDSDNLIFYGATSEGGTYNNGYVFSYEINTNHFNIIKNIETHNEAISFCKTQNNEIYGVMSNSHGTYGSIIKMDTPTTYSVGYPFNDQLYGHPYRPFMIFSVDNYLYVVLFYITGYSQGYLLLQFDNNMNYNRLSDGYLSDKSSQYYLMDDHKIFGLDYSHGPYYFYPGDQNISYTNLTYPYQVFGIIDGTNRVSKVINIDKSKEITIYPNPANDNLNIISSSDNTIKKIYIYNLQGQKVKVFDNSFDKLNLADLNKGVYLLKIMYNKHKTINLKFIKK